MTKTMPKWATRLLAALALLLTYVVHHAALIPPGYKLFGIVDVLGAVNTGLLALAAIGINGPQLWPGLAAWMGNPPGADKPPVG